MVAVKRISVLSLILLVVPLFSCSDNAFSSEGGVIDALEKRVAKSLVRLGEKIEECSKASDGSVPVFDKEKLDELGATPEGVVVALGHLNYNKRFQCERDERLALVYDLALLKAAGAELGLAPKDGTDYDGLLFPPVETLEYSVRYEKMPANLRDYFESVVGKTPFELAEALDANASLLRPETR